MNIGAGAIERHQKLEQAYDTITKQDDLDATRKLIGEFEFMANRRDVPAQRMLSLSKDFLRTTQGVTRYYNFTIHELDKLDCDSCRYATEIARHCPTEDIHNGCYDLAEQMSDDLLYSTLMLSAYENIRLRLHDVFPLCREEVDQIRFVVQSTSNVLRNVRTILERGATRNKSGIADWAQYTQDKEQFSATNLEGYRRKLDTTRSTMEDVLQKEFLYIQTLGADLLIMYDFVKHYKDWRKSVSGGDLADREAQHKLDRFLSMLGSYAGGQIRISSKQGYCTDRVAALGHEI